MRTRSRPAAPRRAVSSYAPVIVVRPLRPATSSTPWLLALALGSSLCMLAVLLLTALLFTYGYYQISGQIVPGVRVGEVRLEGMTVSQAAVELNRRWNLETHLLVTNGLGAQAAVAPADLGLSLDPLQTAQRAHEVGHGGWMLSEMGQIIAGLSRGYTLAPVVTLDENAACAGLQALSPALSQPPRDATLRLEGDALVAVPAELGYTINLDQTLAVLAADPQIVLVSNYLQVILQPVPPAVTDVAPAIAQAQRLLDTPARLQVYDAITDESLSFDIPRQSLAGWLAVTATAAGPQVALEPAGVARYLDEISASLGPGRYLDSARYSPEVARALSQGLPALVIASHPATSYTIQPGDTLLKIGWKLGFPYWMILNANPGLDPDNLLAGAQLVIPSKDNLLPLPIVPNKRIVLDISRQRLWAYQDGKQLSEYVISTGIDRSPTQPGVFQVQTHERNAYASVWDLYMPHFLGIYEAWPGFMNGIHGLPTLSSGQRLWASILGQPASYGCIILDLADAKWLYGWAEDGVVVEIKT
ncbi:MAG: L,D-transpeptidase family protein [Chloroflexota bacterium]